MKQTLIIHLILCCAFFIHFLSIKDEKPLPLEYTQ